MAPAAIFSEFGVQVIDEKDTPAIGALAGKKVEIKGTALGAWIICRKAGGISIGLDESSPKVVYLDGGQAVMGVMASEVELLDLDQPPSVVFAKILEK